MKLFEVKTNDIQWEVHYDVLCDIVQYYGRIDNKRTKYFSSTVELIKLVEEYAEEMFAKY